jgi:ABC-type glutathione transport system ATPase component
MLCWQPPLLFMLTVCVVLLLLVWLLLLQGLAGKTVVLATNQLQFVSLSDLVVVMRGGTAVEVGSYSQLLAAGGTFAALMKEAQVRLLPDQVLATRQQPRHATNASHGYNTSTPHKMIAMLLKLRKQQCSAYMWAKMRESSCALQL